MPPKKGMSHEDKLATMQKVMMDSKDVWTLKDLERECPKRGIVQMAVKDVLQELVDNDLVSFDKIGSSNFYWCFPSDAYNKRQVTTQNLTGSIKSLEEELNSLEQEISELEPGREDSDDRTALNQEIAALEEQLTGIEQDLSKYSALNPAAVREAERQADIALTAANRWTDNIFSIKSWVAKRFGVQSSEFDKQFGLDEAFDYVS